jgi:hypothetical protein
VNRKWFVRRGRFAVPNSAAGAVLTVLTVAFIVPAFVAVDRFSHSATDTLYGVFPFAACAFLLLDWIAQRTGASLDT